MAQISLQSDDSQSGDSQSGPDELEPSCGDTSTADSGSAAAADSEASQARRPSPAREQPPGRSPGFRAAFWTVGLAVIVWPAGLIISLAALIRPKTPPGPGRALGAGGVVVSLVVAAASIGIVLGAHRHPADPGCAAAQPAIAALSDRLDPDESAVMVATDQNNPATLQQAVASFTADLMSADAAIKHAQSVTSDQNLQFEAASVDKDLAAAISTLRNLPTDDTSIQVALSGQSFNALLNDQQGIDSACG